MLRFEFHIGGYFGISHDVVFKNSTLVYSSSEIFKQDMSSNQILNVSNDSDWDLFICFLEKLKWEERYDDPDILDGTQWALKFANKNANLNISGSNSYPRDFKKFLNLLNNVLAKYNIEVY